MTLALNVTRCNLQRPPCVSASQAGQEEGRWEVQKGEGPSQQIRRQSQEEGV